MTPDQAARAFDRFYRGDRARTRGGGWGSGLGLAIVDSLVRAHGGRAGIHTTPGAVTNVRLPLPRHA